jgi:uncharacterized protein (DUF488 family)
VFTIGHSTRPIEAFVELLRQNAVDFVVDIRTVPKSRTNPQYNADVLASALTRAAIGYAHIAALGGLRPKRRDVAPDVNAFWDNASFHNYADYAMTQAFRSGLDALRALARDKRCAIMCAEAVWWRCHRRIVADYAITKRVPVWHIFTAGKATRATRTPFAKLDRRTRTLRYPK